MLPLPPRIRGFAFSADILLALVLLTSLFIFASLPTQPAPNLEERRITDQFIDDVFVALDHSGYVGNELDTNGFSALSLQRIHTKTTSLLPSNYDVYLELTQYPVDVNNCRTSQTFDQCFPDANATTLSYGASLPSTAEFVHGRRIFLQQQPASQCTASLAPAPTFGGPFSLAPHSSTPLALQSSNELNVSFDVNVSPAGPWTCDQNITVNLSVATGSGTRKPVDMMLVIDRSGSMSYDVQVSTTDAQALDLDANVIFVADSTGGLRDLNLIEAGYPSLVGTYNTPGTARDVDTVGAYSFIADGTAGLRVANVGTITAPSSLAQLVLGGDAYGVASTGNTTWVATVSTGTTTDISNTGTSNNVLTVGRNASGLTAAQSFQPTIAYITGASARVRKVGSPGDLLVSVRSSISGSDLASGTIAASSVTTSYQQLTATFSDALGLTPGTTYYLVFSTAATNGSNYYEVGARNGNTYGNGQAYQNTTAQSSWDMRFETFFLPGLIRIDTTTKDAPVVVGAAALTDPWRIWLSGTTAYVADGSAGLRIFDVSANTPALLGTYNSSGTAYDVMVSGSTAYLSDGSAGLRTIDVSTPTAPALLGTYNTPGTAYATRVNGSRAYVADGSSIQVISISNPASPSFITSYATPWTYRDLEIQYPWAYIALDSGSTGIASVNLEDGSKMTQAILAATTFVDFNGWDSDSDQIGMVSYSSSPTLDQTLTHDYSLVKADINALVANGGTATGDGIATATSHLASGQSDVTNTGGQNQVLVIGQTTTNEYGVQSFQPTLPYLSRIDVYVRRVNSPGIPLTVNLRSSLSGSNIASTTIPVSAIGTSYALETATFSSPVPVTPGATYYIVLSTSSLNATAYFQWGAQSGNPYSGGEAYQNTTAQSTWDGRFATYGQYTNPTALKFQILMSDGETNQGSSSSTAAINARNAGIVIYTIGFGLAADAAELSTIADTTGGHYYAALDQNALVDVYQLIAQDIQLLATDANIAASIPTGTLLVNDGNGILGGGFLTFDINTQTPQPWGSSYTFNIPCDSTLACSSTLLSIPSPGTQFQYVDVNGEPQAIDWNVFSTETFNYRDLNVEIVSGDILGRGNTDLTVRVQSAGNIDTNATSVSFYNGAPSSTTFLTSASVPPLCGQQHLACSTYTYDFTQNVPAEGELFAVVNPTQSIHECSYNNQDVIFCYSAPSTTFYTLDYWAWLRD